MSVILLSVYILLQVENMWHILHTESTSLTFGNLIAQESKMIASEQATCFQKDFVYIHDMGFFLTLK